MPATSSDRAKAPRMGTIGPDEEVMLLEHSVLSGIPESAANVRGYGVWFQEQDATLGYAYLKKMLRSPLEKRTVVNQPGLCMLADSVR